MSAKERIIICAVVVWLWVSFSRIGFAGAVGNDARAVRTSALKDLITSVEGTPKEPARIFKTKDGYLRFIGAAPSTYFAVATGTPEEMADAFLGKWRNLFVNKSSSVEFQKIRVKTQNGRSYVRYQQIYAGLEVFAAEMIVQVNSSGGIDAVISDIMRDTGALDTKNVLLEPAIDALTAQKKGIEFLSEQHKKLEFEASAPALMIYAPEVVGNKGVARLVWQMQVVNVGEPLVKENVFIDAHSGEIAFHYSLIYSAMNRQIYDCNSGIWYYENSNWPTGIPDVDQAYDYLGDTYHFYDVNHGRDSYDDAGANLVAFVRHNMSGASWSGGSMTIGEGFATDDVIGHEFTHGVTECESALIPNSGESGAINESFCDMWGEWIDQTNGDDAPEVKWYIGEDTIVGSFRNMKNPHEFDDPELLYEQDYWDWGSNVHKNKGVGNKLCYLLTDGDYFRGHTITGMGISKTADLFYECQTGLIPRACDYYDLYQVITYAAKTLEMTWDERVNIEEACQAVAIANDPLVHWWKLDEGSGTIAYDSVDDKNGTLTNMDPLTDWVTGKRDGALEFDGVNDYVALGPIDALALQGNTVTISAWIKPDDVSRNYSPILTQGYACYWGYYLCLNGANPTFCLYGVSAVSDEPIYADEWYHLAGTYDSKKLKIYVNGVLKATQDYPECTGGSFNAYIGSDEQQYNHFQGIIDDVRVYRRAVDVDEILDKMFYGTSKFSVKNTSGVRVAWFDDLGNLFLKGSKQTNWQPPSDETSEFITKNDSGSPVAYINDSGNLYLQGSLTVGQTPIATSADEFRVLDSTGADVAIIDTTNGDIKIKGKLYEQNP